MDTFGFRFISLGTQWIVRIVVASLLLLVFTCLGAGIFGVMPAMVGLFSVTRAWSRGRFDIKIASVYWKTFRGEFVSSNIVGLIYGAAACILVVDISHLLHRHSLIGYLAIIPSLLVAMFYLMNVVYIFPVMSHYKANAFQYIRIAAVLVGTQPMISLLLVVIVGCYAILLRGLIPVLGISLVALFVTWLSNPVLERGHSVRMPEGTQTAD
ncbi:YesL family protein [Alicyclobacillus acidiphilus]|uniref:YesL family protein n=1 Tax=Alicyclobacillus acidiphilus TaxID=182455 RepID=UPI00082DEB48|nr:DUF624 domain-containing protein [Alicyclobacillus acidiphilus]